MAKTNAEILAEAPVDDSQVEVGNTAQFGSSTDGSDSANTSNIPEGIPEATLDPADVSGKNKIVDVSDLPTEGFGLDTFQDILKGGDGAPKKENSKEKEATKEDEEVKEEVTGAATKEESQQQQQDRGIKGVPRDYAGFEPKEVDALKKMSNASFAYVAPILKEHKNLGRVIAEKDNTIAQLKTGKQILPDNYFEHPQAFVLTKEYNDNAQALNDSYTIQQHWQQQMINIRKGEPWFDLNRDAKTGKLVKSAPQAASIEAEAEVMSLIHSSVNQVAKFQQAVGAIQGSFKERHENAVKFLKEAEDKNFDAFKDPNHPMQPVIRNILASMPAEFRNNPLARITAKAGAAALQFGNLYKAALAEIAELKKGIASNGGTKTAESRQGQAGPTKANMQANGGGGKQGNTVGTKMEDFMAAME